MAAAQKGSERQRSARVRSAAGLALLAMAILFFAEAAGARQFQMSGTWAMRRGAIFWPLQFAISKMAPGHTNTSAGDLSMAYGFPNGPVPGVGAVTATGSGPATLVVPPHRFGGMFSTQLPVPGAYVFQITSMLDADGPAAPATLAPDAGPGSFTWCPGDPACVDLPGTIDPPGPGGRGRIVYRAGANRFGGVMQMLLQGSSTRSTIFGNLPIQTFRAVHVYQAPTALLDSGIQATGGAYATQVFDLLPRWFVTQPLVPPTPSGLITAPGPKVTTMFGTTGASGTPKPTFFGPTLLTTPMGRKIGTAHSQTGFPFTTGTVIAQQTWGSSGDDFFTVMGSDMRTALGAGNISLVAGGLGRVRSPYFDTRHALFGVVRMTLSPPVPTLSPAGLAAAALLVLLAVGYALRRRR